MKKEKGITLIALVITIIVLLILAGVSISLVLGQNGVLTQSKTSVTENKKATAKEEVTMAWAACETDYWNAWAKDSSVSKADFFEGNNGNPGLSSYLTTGTLTNFSYGENSTLDYEKSASEKYALTVNSKGEVTGILEVSGQGGSSTPATPTSYTAYVVGQEVTVGEESFYVLEASDASQSTVTLLAKYNLNKDGTAQAPNASTSATGVPFSSTKYWASAHAAYTDWASKNLDINTVSGEVEGDAIYKAKAYATSKGGTNGRLLTYEEADSLKTSYGDMIWGKANQQGESSSYYYLSYWFSSASKYSDDYMWLVYGDYSCFDGFFPYFDEFHFGVRPVITVSKSLVS